MNAKIKKALEIARKAKENKMANGGEIEKEFKCKFGDSIDTVKFDIPLMIRLLEYAKEDAKTDMDLHGVTENATRLSKEKDILTMDDYDKIIGKYEDGGEIRKNKKWRVSILERKGDSGMRGRHIIIELGRASDKNDVMQEIKRQGIEGEILSITEVFADGGEISYSEMEKFVDGLQRKSMIMVVYPQTYEKLADLLNNEIIDELGEYAQDTEKYMDVLNEKVDKMTTASILAEVGDVLIEEFGKGGEINVPKQFNDTRDYVANPVTEDEMRATYVMAFGQEFDDPKRKQSPLPLDIAYMVAVQKLNDTKLADGGTIDAELSGMEDWLLESKITTLRKEKEAGNYDANSEKVMLKLLEEVNRRQGEKLKKALSKEFEVENDYMKIAIYATKDNYQDFESALHDLSLSFSKAKNSDSNYYEHRSHNIITFYTKNKSEFEKVIELAKEFSLKYILGKAKTIEMANGGAVKNEWIQEAIKHRGILRNKAKSMGLIKGDEKLSEADLDKLEGLGGKWKKRVTLARTLRKFEDGGNIKDEKRAFEYIENQERKMQNAKTVKELIDIYISDWDLRDKKEITKKQILSGLNKKYKGDLEKSKVALISELRLGFGNYLQSGLEEYEKGGAIKHIAEEITVSMPFADEGSVSEKGIEAWSFGEKWNGWAVPYFEKVRASQVAKDMGGIFLKKDNAYKFVFEGEPEIFESKRIITTHGLKEVWPIGAMAWTWESSDMFENGGSLSKLEVLSENPSEAQCEEYLTWLSDSKYAYHIDDNPFEVVWDIEITDDEKKILFDNTMKCEDIMGNARMWDIYNPVTEEEYGNGGEITRENSLQYAIVNQVSSGTIANYTGYNKYKDVDAIRFLSWQILNRDGDKVFSIETLKALLSQAVEEYKENNYEMKFQNGGKIKTLLARKTQSEEVFQINLTIDGHPLSIVTTVRKGKFGISKSVKPEYSDIIIEHVAKTKIDSKTFEDNREYIYEYVEKYLKDQGLINLEKMCAGGTMAKGGILSEARKLLKESEMEVELSAVPNVDWPSDTHEGSVRIKSRMVPVNSFGRSKAYSP